MTTAAGTADALDDNHQLEPWLSAEAQQARRAALGMDEPQTAAFTAAHEFVSLGCFCGVARTLQALGLKKYAYPFDWVRCPVDGIIHCLDVRFEDFLTFTGACQPSYVSQRVFTAARWGGSFWHHDPMAPGTADAFARRAERLFGWREVPASQARVFVWAVNSSRELDAAPRLLEALRRALPQAEVRLLVLVDFQRSKGPRCLAGPSSEGLLFYLLHEDLFGPHSSPSRPQASAWTMQRHCEAYAEAVAFATAHWAGREEASGALAVYPDLASLAAACRQWDGGSPSNELFLPRHLQGPRLLVRPPHALARTPSPCGRTSAPLRPGRASLAVCEAAARWTAADLGVAGGGTGQQDWSGRRSASPGRQGEPKLGADLAFTWKHGAERLEPAAPPGRRDLSPAGGRGRRELLERAHSDLSELAERRTAESELRLAALREELKRVRSPLGRKGAA